MKSVMQFCLPDLCLINMLHAHIHTLKINSSGQFCSKEEARGGTELGRSKSTTNRVSPEHGQPLQKR